MTEWQVVLVIVTLVGLVATILGAALKVNNKFTDSLINFTNTNTKLDTTVTELGKQLLKLEDRNSDNHSRIWEHSEAQDKVLNEHDRRITILERKDEK